MSLYPALPSLPPGRPMSALLKRQGLALPITLIVLGGLGTWLAMLDVAAAPLEHRLILVPLFMLVTALGVAFYWWLDRWEPEPTPMLASAFLWGAGVATLVSGIVNVLVALSAGTWLVAVLYSAPLIEETTKGAFLLLLLASRTGRGELNSVIDVIVYAGFVGMGFTLVEDISYALRGESIEQGLSIAVMRITTGTFLHALFTTMTALGIWAGLQARGVLRVVYPALGWAAAVGLHFLHNYNAVYVVAGPIPPIVIELLSLGAVLFLALRSRAAEEANLRQQLPVLVERGWLSPREAGWLADRGARRDHLRRVRQAGRPEHRLLKDFIQNATELCFLRARLDRLAPGQHRPAALQTHAMLVGLLVLQRPLVDGLLATGAGGGPMAPAPGPGYGAELPSQRPR